MLIKKTFLSLSLSAHKPAARAPCFEHQYIQTKVAPMATSIAMDLKYYPLELNFDNGAAKVHSYNC